MHLGSLHGVTAQCWSKGVQSAGTSLCGTALCGTTQCVAGPIRLGDVRRVVMFDDDVTGITPTLRSRREDHVMQLLLTARCQRRLDVVRIVERIPDSTEEEEGTETDMG